MTLTKDKRKDLEIGDCVICGKKTRKIITLSNSKKSFYCGCLGKRVC
jgi:hypothetical protein